MDLAGGCKLQHHTWHQGAIEACSPAGPAAGLLPAPSTAPPRLAAICQSQAIAYRPIVPADLPLLREVHEELFPIRYEEEFYECVVAGDGVMSWAAVDTARPDELVGFVTARVVPFSESEELIGCELCSDDVDLCLVYILTLGVTRPYRNLGIASSLVWRVIDFASDSAACRAVYLHVIAYNRDAILFYQKNLFRCLRRLPAFYAIDGHSYDAFLYVYYVNGGRPPCSAIDILSSTSGFVRGLFSAALERLFGRKEDDDKNAKWYKCRDVCGPHLGQLAHCQRLGELPASCPCV